MNRWVDNILQYHFTLSPDLKLPGGVEWLFPYDNPETRKSMQLFYSRFFSDTNRRILLLGINPGRFGAGITGVPFTDPVRLETDCEIPNTFRKRKELSSVFVYDFIHAFGGPQKFYKYFYISSLCPLGFIKDGKNFNYYDSMELQELVTPVIVENLQKQLHYGASSRVALCLGQGKNFKYLSRINATHSFFKEVIPLPHPRWVMQYRLKLKDEFVLQVQDALNKSLSLL
jgi:hypothetical protein